MEILQPLNEAVELGNSKHVTPTHGEEVRRDKGEGAKVAKFLVRGRMVARRTLVATRKYYANARRPSNLCARREASAPPRVDASTDLWQVSQGVNTPPAHAGSR